MFGLSENPKNSVKFGGMVVVCTLFLLTFLIRGHGLSPMYAYLFSGDGVIETSFLGLGLVFWVLSFIRKSRDLELAGGFAIWLAWLIGVSQMNALDGGQEQVANLLVAFLLALPFQIGSFLLYLRPIWKKLIQSRD